ncbi:uncharacterized protein LOC134063592 [Sardina pilchardus]|uniref:uncharacterized protein LOC134063592 n=1 Tax=Sardina pilchardus TaxID=27697 RepID=UPI002E0EE906
MERPESLGHITIPAVKLKNRLVQNPSAEVVVNEVPKGHSTSPYSEEDLYHGEVVIENVLEMQGLMERTGLRCALPELWIPPAGQRRQLLGPASLPVPGTDAHHQASLLAAAEEHLLISEQLESQYGLIKGWLFPDICKHTSGIENSVGLLKCYLCLLQNWHATAAFPEVEGCRSVCEQLFQGGEDDFGVIEALKLLILAHAVDLHTAIQRGDNVPIFCSLSPRSYLANHLSQVGFSRGMEQGFGLPSRPDPCVELSETPLVEHGGTTRVWRESG